MAEQFAPIAKDESFNTTDLTPKNIADVLKDGLQNIADSVKPTADEIPFDNTGTSLVSTDVEGAIKEVNSAIVKTSTEVTGSPSVNINVPSSGNYIGYIYLSPYTSTGVQSGGGAYAIKNYNGRVHLTEIKQASGVTVSSITVNTGSVTVTFNTNLSSFIQAVVFKL